VTKRLFQLVCRHISKNIVPVYYPRVFSVQQPYIHNASDINPSRRITSINDLAMQKRYCRGMRWRWHCVGETTLLSYLVIKDNFLCRQYPRQRLRNRFAIKFDIGHGQRALTAQRDDDVDSRDPSSPPIGSQEIRILPRPHPDGFPQSICPDRPKFVHPSWGRFFL